MKKTVFLIVFVVSSISEAVSDIVISANIFNIKVTFIGDRSI